MKTFPITEIAIRQQCTEKVYARGVEYFDDGMVLEVVQRGDLIQAQVQGSEDEPYLVSVGMTKNGIADAGCTCPYGEEWDGWCKHIVAVLLFCMDVPEEVEVRTPLSKQLATLDRDALQALVLSLASRHPRLTDDIESSLAPKKKRKK